ncbi:hypothetical protein SAMN04487949_0874 [Halogranum gelatinilyticum]|uniref:Uncharacterized protein n=1 Tax=Halogranum gelatinilyticum TaxID=660521 RepID=A0A1G9QI33_9EURY|nr:hypothetical protein [Halogranum gelatinilyticum]SDM10718.1 hypothetical protein SAMN04487949_0874 [Halogranum gelatinilyticum]
MFDVPLDAWYSWIGLALAGVALLGVVSSLPTTPPPDANAVANTVDRLAAGDHVATAEHPLDASAVKLGPHRVSLRNDAGTVHAAYAFGPVTPVADGSALQRVLYGQPPSTVFESERAFHQAVVEARTREPTWETVDRTLVVRRVSWGETDVTLVDA